MSTYVALKRLLLSASLIGYSLYHFLVALKRLLLFYWLLYSAITETRPCDLGLIALLLLRLMYGKLNHYVIKLEIIKTCGEVDLSRGTNQDAENESGQS